MISLVGIALASFLISALTLLAGFGLGTLLLPVFILFFPVEVAVAMTAVVHLANNIFKLFLVARFAVWDVVLRFGLPAALLSFLGAKFLGDSSRAASLGSYSWLGRQFVVQPVTLLIGILMVVFALFELHPRLRRLTFARSLLPLGGAISGFFGGLSGHQGALRAAFFSKSGLTKEAFVGTSAVCAVIVDVTRLWVYGETFLRGREALQANGGTPLLLLAILSAFAGSYVGKRVLPNISAVSVHYLVGVLLMLFGTAMAAGWLS